MKQDILITKISVTYSLVLYRIFAKKSSALGILCRKIWWEDGLIYSQFITHFCPIISTIEDFVTKCCRGVFFNVQSARKPFVSKGFRALVSRLVLFPLFFVVLLWLIYALNIIPNSNLKPVFLPVISFFKILLQKKLQNRLWNSVEWLWCNCLL